MGQIFASGRHIVHQESSKEQESVFSRMGEFTASYEGTMDEAGHGAPLRSAARSYGGAGSCLSYDLLESFGA